MNDNQERIGKRVLALAGIWLLLAGLLTASSLVVVGLAMVALLLAGLIAAGTVWLMRRIELRPVLEDVASSTAATSRAVRARVPKPRVREHGRSIASRARATAAGAPHRSEAVAARAFEGSVKAMYRVGLLKRHSVDPSRLARELNRLGAQLRREGEPEQAVDQHRAALEIVRDLGDQQAEAMTLNNLGLALAHSGAGTEAVEYLEHARTVLHELGDKEHEGQVIANLGLVYRRQGETDEAAVLFQEALDRLPPGSSAYRQIEDELRRAS